MVAVDSLHLPCGMAVTASHNPAVYNGVKLFTHGGRDADARVTAALEARMESLEGAPPPRAEFDAALETGMISLIDPMNAYIDAIIAAVDMNAIRACGLKVALDPMYGVSKTALQTILITARCDVDVIHERRDALFGGRLPAPNVQTLEAVSYTHLDVYKRQMQKYFRPDHLAKKDVANEGQLDRYFVENHHAPLIDRTTRCV